MKSSCKNWNEDEKNLLIKHNSLTDEEISRIFTEKKKAGMHINLRSSHSISWKRRELGLYKSPIYALMARQKMEAK
jgi:hypothetical protein